jgi:hypothetical protein
VSAKLFRLKTCPISDDFRQMIAIGGVIVSELSYHLISPILTLNRVLVSSWERVVI